MRFLIIGCGSMGKRRARVLKKLGYEDVLALDTRADRLEEMHSQSPHVRGFGNFDRAVEAGADMALICVPPHRHIDFLLKCIDLRIPAFCEGPLVMTLDEMDRVIEESKKRQVFIAPSCTYLHAEVHHEVKKIIDSGRIGKPLAMISHVGHHVANWHPYEDYRGFYASKRSEGGMCFDMLPHDFHTVEYLLGDVCGLSCMARMRSENIETDEGACDVYDVILDMKSGASVVVHQDMFQRPFGHYRKIMGESGAVEWNWKTVRLCEYKGSQFHDEPEWETVPLSENYHLENAYDGEILHVIRACEGKEKYLMPLEKERRILEWMLACEESSRKGIHITW